MRQLYLEHDLSVQSKGHLAGDQVVAPHPAEPVIVQRAGLVDPIHESIMPMTQRFGIVQPPHLDIGGDQRGVLDRACHFRQCRHISSGKDVFGDPGAGGSGRCDAPDGMDQRHAVRRQKLMQLVKILTVMGHTDMFEHAH